MTILWNVKIIIFSRNNCNTLGRSHEFHWIPDYFKVLEIPVYIFNLTNMKIRKIFHSNLSSIILLPDNQYPHPPKNTELVENFLGISQGVEKIVSKK